MLRYTFTLATLLTLTTSTYPQVSRIDGHHAKSYVEILASDSLQGRRSGLPGGEKAAAWIAEQFRSFGLRPGVGGSSYFQNFTITTAVESGPMVMRGRVGNSVVQASPPVVRLQTGTEACTTDTIIFQYGKDFVSFAYGGEGIAQGQVVFIGYGIQEPGKGRDDLSGVDLKGKIALALRGAPDDGEGWWGREGGHGYKAAHAAAAGAVGYLQVGDGPCMQRTLGLENRPDNVPCFWISKEACTRILKDSGLNVDSLFTQANSHRDGCNLKLPAILQLEAHAGIIPNAATCNVVGYFPGADPELAHETVIIGAHMDHLGMDAIGRIFHGADDNASGTAMVLELARALAADPIPPRRSVYFCAFAGEDLGLLGSEEFVANPPIPLDSIVTMINLDMVGVGQGISIGGFPNFPRIWELWGSVLSDPLRQNLRHFKPGYYSDHAPFQELGIPAFFLDTGGNHPNYHQPEDAAELIQPELLVQVGDVVYRGLRAMADHPVPLAESDRLVRYLWRSSETVLIDAPTIPPSSKDDHPDLILYEAGKTIDPSSRNRLRRLLLELTKLDSTLNADSLKLRRVVSLQKVPSGQVIPAVAVGLASPRLVENQPEIFPLLKKLGVLFIHVPEDEKRYFGVRGLKKPAYELIAQLASAPQAIIWEVDSPAQAGALIAATTRPLVIRISGACKLTGKEGLKIMPGQFLLLSERVASSMDFQEFRSLGAQIGWTNLGVEAASLQEAQPLITTWQKENLSAGRIRDLLGLNLIRYWQREPGVRHQESEGK